MENVATNRTAGSNCKLTPTRAFCGTLCRHMCKRLKARSLELTRTSIRRQRFKIENYSSIYRPKGTGNKAKFALFERPNSVTTCVGCVTMDYEDREIAFNDPYCAL